jgi:ribosomal protein L37AE/L43A
VQPLPPRSSGPGVDRSEGPKRLVLHPPERPSGRSGGERVAPRQDPKPAMVVRGPLAEAAYAAAKAAGRSEDVLAVVGEGPSCPTCRSREQVYREGRQWLCYGCNLLFEGTREEWEAARRREREPHGAPPSAQQAFAVATEQLAKKVEDEEGDEERDD